MRAFGVAGSARRAICMVLMAAAGMSTVSAARSQEATAVAQADDPAIRSHWQAIDRHWDERDAERFSELFAADAIFEIVKGGQRLEGRDAIRSHFAQQFPGFAPELRHRTSVEDVRFPSPDVGVVEGGVEILRLPESEGEAAAVLRRFSIAGVMLRTADGWRIHTLHAYPL